MDSASYDYRDMSARQKNLAAHGIWCSAAGQNLESGQVSRHFIAEISLNVILNHNQPTKHLYLRFPFL